MDFTPLRKKAHRKRSEINKALKDLEAMCAE